MEISLEDGLNERSCNFNDQKDSKSYEKKDLTGLHLLETESNSKIHGMSNFLVSDSQVAKTSFDIKPQTKSGKEELHFFKSEAYEKKFRNHNILRSIDTHLSESKDGEIIVLLQNSISDSPTAIRQLKSFQRSEASRDDQTPTQLYGEGSLMSNLSTNKEVSLKLEEDVSTSKILQNMDDSQSYYSNGLELCKNNKFEEALLLLQNVHGTDLNYLDSQYLVANIQLLQNRPLEAIKILKRIIEIEPFNDKSNLQISKALLEIKKFEEPRDGIDTTEVSLLISSILAKQGDFIAASTHLEKVLSLNPSNLQANHQKISLLILQNKLQGALTALDSLRELEPMSSIQYYLQIAKVFATSNKFDDSVRILEQALTIDPDNEQVNLDLGGAYLLRNKIKNSTSRFQKATEINPQNIIARFNLSFVLRLNGKDADALENFYKILGNDIDPTVKRALAFIFAKPNKKNSNKNTPLLAKSKINFSQSEIAENSNEEEFFKIDTSSLNESICSELSPRTSSNYSDLGIIDNLSFEELDEELSELFKDPEQEDHFMNHYILGLSYQRQKKFSEAIDKFKEAIKAAPEYSFLYVNCGEALLMKGKYQEALDKLNEAKKLNPYQWVPYFFLDKITVCSEN